MPFLSYIFFKDCRRFRFILFFWFVLIVAQLILEGLRLPWIQVYSIHTYFLLSLQAVLILQFIVKLILIPLVIQEEPLGDPNAFWLTRPIRRSALLITKVVFILLFLVILPLIMETMVLSFDGFAAHYQGWLVLQTLQEGLPIIVFLMLIASLTSSLRNYIIVMFVYFVISILAGIIFYAVSLIAKFALPATFKMELISSKRIVVDIFKILWGTGLIIHQFMTRYQARTLRWLIVGIFLGCLLFYKWNLNVFPGTTISAPQFSNLQINIDQKNIRVAKYVKDYLTLNAPVSLINLNPGQFGFLLDILSPKIALPNKETISSTDINLPFMSMDVIEEVSGFRRSVSAGLTKAISYILEGKNILNPYPQKIHNHNLFILDHDQLAQISESKIDYSSRGQAEIYQLGLPQMLSFYKRERLTMNNQSWDIIGSSQKNKILTVDLGVKELRLLFDPTQPDLDQKHYFFIMDPQISIFGLWNSRRNEILLSEPAVYDPNHIMDKFYGAHLKVFPKFKQIKFDLSFLKSTGETTEAWLANAQLMIMPTQKIGTQMIPIQLNGIDMKPETNSAKILKSGTVHSVEITRFGRVAPEDKGDAEHFNVCLLLADSSRVEETTDVPAILKTGFGFVYKPVKGEGEGDFAKLKLRFIHPPIITPSTGESKTVEDFERHVTFDKEDTAGWEFGYEWEIVPGEWKIQILNGEKVLAEKVFNVTAVKDVYQYVPDMGKQIQAFKEYIAQHPQDAMAVKNLGNFYLDQGDNDQAIAQYNAAIKINLHPNFYNNLCLAWNNKGDYERAMANCNEALRLNPGHTTAFINRGNTFRLLGQYDKAIADYNESLRVTPPGETYNPPMAYYNRGLTYMALTNYQAALADFTKAIEFNHDPAYYCGRANAYKSLGQWNKYAQDIKSCYGSK